MSDLISRQALMKEFSDFVRASNNSDFARTPTWNDAVSLVGSMPSAQPERCEDCGNFNKTRLLIPQPEIVRCKNCKHNPKREWFGCPMSHLNEKQRPETAWCWKGEPNEADYRKE